MGREIKRVQPDFDWEIGKLWYGYCVSVCLCDEPYNFSCDDCKKFGKITGLSNGKECPKIEGLEPPSGDGYQLWTTTTEGSPMTPVFKTPEDLARYCENEEVSSFGSCTADYETWLKFIKGPGWAPSAIVSNGKIKSGVESVE